jgi:hypothetical protein
MAAPDHRHPHHLHVSGARDGVALSPHVGVRAVCEGAFDLPLPMDEARRLFTPEGERGWAGEHWDPVYPAGSPAPDGATAGTVFTTESSGGAATWVVVAATASRLAYARVVPGELGGTVDVTLTATDGGCRVAVVYDVTSLGPAGARFVRELEAGYDQFLRGWRGAILAAR